MRGVPAVGFPLTTPLPGERDSRSLLSEAAMDSNRFDALPRPLSSRRTTLRGLLIETVALLEQLISASPAPTRFLTETGG